MMISVADMYTRFLYGIDKEGTTTVYPEKFNELINEAQGLVVNEMADEVQVNRRRLDDLYLFTSTFSNKIPIYPLGSDGKPDTTQTPFGFDYTKQLPMDYFRELNIKFKLSYKEETVGATYDRDTQRYVTDKFYWGVPIRSDNKPIALNNPYRSTNRLFEDGKVYHEVMGDNIKVIDYEYQEYVMEYLVTPLTLRFNELNPAGHSEGTLTPRMRQIITDRAIRIFIERTENPRYQTALNEDAHKNF